MPMTEERWRYLLNYPDEVFGKDEDSLRGLSKRAREAGLPNIAIPHGTGQLLSILVSMTNARLAVELGTLGGFSATWITRGLKPDGRLITIEYEDRHADFAEAEFEASGISAQVEVRRGAALDVLPLLAAELGEGSIDFAFIDAVKGEYTQYFDILNPLVAPGGLVVADNVYGTGKGWLDEGHGTDDFNRHVADSPEFTATTVHVGAGLLIARKS